MRDFPVFTTNLGVASLVLKEIPYRQTAYILIRDVQPENLPPFLQECADFCRMAGAEKIFASGHEALSALPLSAAVLEMRGVAWVDPEKSENLFPVTERSVGRWREIYNERMKNVDNAGTLERGDEEKILQSGGAYFVHRDGELLGVGWLDDCRLLALAAVKSGAGERVLHSLMSLAEGDSLTLEVASTNKRAIRLYERSGFMQIGEISRWYSVNPTKKQ